MEDATCAQIWKLISHILSERCSNALAMSDAYPGTLAGILGNSEQQCAAMERFKTDWLAYCDARASSISVVRKMCHRSTLNTRGMEQLARIAKRAGWVANEELTRRVAYIFDGIGTEDILEDSLGSVRDAEYRDQQSKVLRMYKAYEVPVLAEKLKAWDRSEIVPRPELAVPNGLTTEDEDDELFKPVARPEVNLKAVQASGADHDWQTFTPTTLQVVHIESAFLRHARCHLAGDLSSSEELWRNSIVPVHHVIVLREDGAHETHLLYSLKCTESGILGWPLIRSENGRVRLLGTGARVEFYFCTTFEQVFVFPFQVQSPLKSFLQGVALGDISINATLAAEPVDVLTYQASRGFAGVSEQSLTKLAGKYPRIEKILDEPLVDGMPLDLHLASELVLELLPAIDEEDFQKAMHTRSIESGDVESHLTDFVDEDDLLEIVESSSHRHMRNFKNKADGAKTYQQHCFRLINSLVQTKFKSGKKKKGSKRSKPKTALTKVEAGRWWASVRGDMAFINAHAPPVGLCHQDDVAGRFLACYPGKRRKSVAWTRRGMKAASTLILRYMWGWHTEATGVQCPYPLEL